MRAWQAGALLLAAGCKPCVDFTPGAPYQCAYGGDPAQCPGGWRCGKAGVCFDPADAGAQPCTFDGGLPDCANGWRCGRDDVCHPLSAPGPYACADDSDCESNWRCDLVQRICADVGSELFPSAISAGALTAHRMSPLVTRDAPQLISGVPPTTNCVTSCIGLPGTIAWAQGNSVHWVAHGNGLEQQTSPIVASGGYAWPRSILGLRQELGVTYLLDSAGLWLAMSDGGTGGAPLWASNGETQLRWGTTSTLERRGPRMFVVVTDELLLAFSASEFSLLDVNGAFLPLLAASIPAPDGGIERIRDMAFAASDFPNGPDAGNWLLAATDDGLFGALATLPAGWTDAGLVWNPIAYSSGRPGAYLWGNPACGTPASDIRRLEVFPVGTYSLANYGPVAPDPDAGIAGYGGYGGDMLAAQVATDAGLFWVYSPDSSFYLGSTGCASPVPLGIWGETPIAGTSLCTPGDDVAHLDLPISIDGQGSDAGGLWVACGKRDAGAPSELRSTPRIPDFGELGIWIALGGQSSIYDDIGAWDDATPGLGAAGGAHGQLWARGDGLLPLLVDVAPHSTGSGPSGQPVVAAGGILYEQSAFGLEPSSLPTVGRPETFVAGQPTWLVESLGDAAAPSSALVIAVDGDGGTLIASMAALTSPLFPPFQALTVPVGAGTELVVTSFNAVYADALGSTAPAIPLRLNLPVQLPITSLDLQPGDGGAFLSGFALSPAGIFALTAQSQAFWTVAPVNVPFGRWVKVWSDQGRTRLGYADGTVIGLPEPVLLAAPFAATACPNELAVDYADLCGQSFALTTCGLYRLVTDGGVGGWAAENTAWPQGFDDRVLSGGALFSASGSLQIFSRFGEGVSLSASAPCP